VFEAGEAGAFQSNLTWYENGLLKLLGGLWGKEVAKEPIDKSKDARGLADDRKGLESLVDTAVEEKEYDKLDGSQSKGGLEMPW